MATIEHVDANKKRRGQFYTTQYAYILEGLAGPPADARCVLEPFAGKGDLLEWLSTDLPVEAYDIEPKRADILVRDTLVHPPDYAGAWVLTNPPYLARNKSAQKEVFDKYGMNDLYKCFILSLGIACRGGILLLPAGFFFSPRDIDVRCRDFFLSTYRITTVKYFEETVFEDTPTTIVAIAFEARPAGVAPYTEQIIPWIRRPSGECKSFCLSKSVDWIVGGEIYQMPPAVAGVAVRRHVEGAPLRSGEQQTFLTLKALDSGSAGGEIALEFREGYVYPAKECSRTYATLRIGGLGRVISHNEQRQLAVDFNGFLSERRGELWSLFLPQYRESKEYARKRIPFELAYILVLHLLKP
jgi:hypothetical protein